MLRRPALALMLLGLPCVALSGACGVSEQGLGSAAVDVPDHMDGTSAGGDEGEAASSGGGASEAGPGGDDATEAGFADGAPDDGFSGDDSSTDGAAGTDGDFADAPLDGASGDGQASKGGDGAVDGGTALDALADAPAQNDGSPESGATEGGSGTGDAGASDATADGAANDAATNDGGDGAASCDFDGTWGSRIVIDVSWAPQGLTGIILASGTGTITQYILGTRTHSGTNAVDTAYVCGIELPDFDGTAIAGGEIYGIRFPNSLFDNAYIPSFTIDATLSGAVPGATYNSTEIAVLLGLTLSNATTTPWPATITTEVDEDQDGNPGVTADCLSGNGYSDPPVDLFKDNRADELFLAIRQVTQVSATASDCNTFSGSVAIPTLTDPSTGTSKPAIDSHVIGCRIAGTSTDCNSTQATFVDNTQPVFTPSGGSSFTSIRMATGSTCAQVRAALP